MLNSISRDTVDCLGVLINWRKCVPISNLKVRKTHELWAISLLISSRLISYLDVLRLF